MIDFSKRSTQPELMDNPALPTQELILALKDIASVNKWLNGNMITVKAIAKLFKEYPEKEHWTIVDFGCGDGQMLRKIAHYFSANTKQLRLIGIDINEKSVALGRSLSLQDENISFEQQDILELEVHDYSCDILLCTLTMHHFSDEEIVIFMRKFITLASTAVIVNDLQRSKTAYKLFKLFSCIFMKSNIAKHDGRVSIARAFRKNELEKYAQQLHLQHYSITWKWAFRYLWLIKTL